jgi:hypothetical protein
MATFKWFIRPNRNEDHCRKKRVKKSLIQVHGTDIFGHDPMRASALSHPDFGHAIISTTVNDAINLRQTHADTVLVTIQYSSLWLSPARSSTR